MSRDSCLSFLFILVTGIHGCTLFSLLTFNIHNSEDALQEEFSVTSIKMNNDLVGQSVIDC